MTHSRRNWEANFPCDKMIIIDGSQGEGGGQVLRTSTALSAILGKPCKIINIRSNRQTPGLREQHLQGITALAKLCNGSVKNAFVGSKEIEFYPGNDFEKEIEINIPTAGSVTLVLQSLMIAALGAKKNLSIKINGGATNTKWSPPADYAQNVLFPLLEKMDYRAELKIKTRGFYPKGGAEITCDLSPPKKLKNLVLDERGGVNIIKGVSICSNLPPNVAERQKKSAEKILNDSGYKTEIKTEISKTHSPGSALVLWAECENSVIGSDSLGEIKKSAEVVGKEAAENMIKLLSGGFSLDLHAADQVIPYAALAEGESSITVYETTLHTMTNIGVCEKLLGVKFKAEKNKISVHGFMHNADRNV